MRHPCLHPSEGEGARRRQGRTSSALRFPLLLDPRDRLIETCKIVCFLPRKACDEYAIVKKFSDVEKGVATQCLFINKAKGGNPQYYGCVSLLLGPDRLAHTERTATSRSRSTSSLGESTRFLTPLLSAPSRSARPVGSFCVSEVDQEG